MEKKIVLITGASSGIGEGCARKFAMNGYRLILNGRNVEKLNAVKKELEEKFGADVYLLPFDVRDRQAACAALESLPVEWKAIDILINNAGLVIGVDKEHEGNLDEWDVVIDTDVKALLAMTRLVVPGMVERGRGQHGVYCRRLRLSGRQCVLCLQSRRQGPFRRTPHRLGGYSGTRDERQARTGGNQFLCHPFPWRPGGG